jgi:hypothetical protein
MFTKKSLQLILFPVILIIIIGIIMVNVFPNDKHTINHYIPMAKQDTLLTDIVTLMGVKPPRTDWQTRHEAQYRQYYINQAKDFNIHKYYIDKEGNHYFYIIRPARHPLGNRRAIGGKMQLNDNFQITGYEEIFVTQVLDEDYLKEIADELFMELINNNLESHLKNRQIIEWPDERLKYHKQYKEWRYDVVDGS